MNASDSHTEQSDDEEETGLRQEVDEGKEGDDENQENVPLNPDDDAETDITLTENQSGVPIDRGWAWVILAGCVFEIFIFGGVMRSFGVFFLEFQKRFNSSASETATMSLVQNVVVSISGLFIMTVGLQKVSCRTMVLTGGVLLVLSYILTAFTTNINVFYVVQGLIGGIGLSCVHPPMYVMLGTYFTKHRGIANSIFTAGASVGGLVFAPIVIKLFEEYGFTGTMLIVAGLLCNIFVSGCLMRPPEFYTNHVKKITKDIISETTLDRTRDNNNVNGRTANASLGSDSSLSTHQVSRNKLNGSAHKLENKHILNVSNVTRRPKFEIQRMVSHDPGMARVTGSDSPVLKRIRANSVGDRRMRTISEDAMPYKKPMNGSLAKLGSIMNSISTSQASVYIAGASVCGSFVDINKHVPPKYTDSVDHEPDKVNVKVTVIQRIWNGFRSVLLTIFDLTLLKDFSFLYFLVLAFCGISSVGLIPIFIPTYANEIGVSNKKIGLLVSILAAIDFFAKISTGLIADKKWIKRNNILGFALFIIGTACHFMRFIKSFEILIIFVIIAGLCCGQYMSIYAVLLSEIIGQERFKKSLGFTTLIHGTSIAIFFPITGLIRDASKSYVNSLHLTGGLAYVACFCALTLPLIQKWAKEKTQKQADEEKQ